MTLNTVKSQKTVVSVIIACLQDDIFLHLTAYSPSDKARETTKTLSAKASLHRGHTGEQLPADSLVRQKHVATECVLMAF
jgi:hypothetical protein